MKILSSLCGNRQIIEKLATAIEHERMPQVCLLVGPPGVGKRALAWGLSQMILCENLQERGCGQCHSCLRTNQRSTEAVLEIRPDGTQIKVEQARQVLDFLHLKSWYSRRVIIIDDVHLMNPQAANSLLKSIEEPPEDTVFFLIAPTVMSVLATIRSRSQVFQMSPLSLAELRTLRPAPEWAIVAARGSLEKLDALIDENEMIEVAQKLLVEFVGDQQFLTNESWRAEVKVRTQAQRVLWWWGLWLIDSVAQKSLLHLTEDLQKTLLNMPVDRKLELLEQCLKSETYIQQFVDPILTFEKTWVEFQYVD